MDDLGTAVVITDDDDRIVKLNGEARRVLDVSEGAALGRPLEEHLPGVSSGEVADSVSIMTDGIRREYAVTTSSIKDGGGTRVGATIVLQDVTEERRREQRLTVLNRVLRHNLRNDLNVVEGYLDVAGKRVEDDELAYLLAIAEEKTLDVIDLAEKARGVENTMNREGDGSERIEVAALLEEVGDGLSEKFKTKNDGGNWRDKFKLG